MENGTAQSEIYFNLCSGLINLYWAERLKSGHCWFLYGNPCQEHYLENVHDIHGKYNSCFMLGYLPSDSYMKVLGFFQI